MKSWTDEFIPGDDQCKRWDNFSGENWKWLKKHPGYKNFIRLLYPPGWVKPIYGISRIGQNRYLVRPMNRVITNDERVYVNGPLSEAKAVALAIARMEEGGEK